MMRDCISPEEKLNTIASLIQPMRRKYSRKRGKRSPRVNGLIDTHVNQVAQKTRFTEGYLESRFQPSDKRPRMNTPVDFH
ncbi:hypothetical protein E2C01_008497 [Portunus trituberculatus]|uniref:Uncharacterized protein n=1 Tax=Portunus trituberculatus TaxID=210409 RepID=A0A5B7D0Z3_PORTR|nr:hypothetical protein [Portunus trituberculatus]